MGADRRGIQQLKTIAGLVDGRRARTSAGALLELSMLEREKTRLRKEIERADRRCAEIRRQLREIAAKQERIQRFVERLPQDGSEPPAAPLSGCSAPTAAIKRRRLAY